MTNGEKFKTAEERGEEFSKFCRSHQQRGCAECELSGCSGDKCKCHYVWLDLEYKEELKEELKECPFCGGTPVMADNIKTKKSLSYYVKCACGVRIVSTFSKRVAAEMWNRRAK